MKTLKLDNDTWDVGIDDVGNIAVVSGNQRLAQDVASSVRVWKGELPFNTDRGIDYGNPDELMPTLNYEINKQARVIDGVQDSYVVFDKLTDRKLNTTIYLTNESGEEVVVGE